MPHLKNKQNKNTNPVISRQDVHLTQPCPSEEKQTKTQHKSHPIQNLHKTLGPTLGGQKPKGRKNSTLKPRAKETSNTICLKIIIIIIIIIIKRQRSTAQMKEQTRNTEVQINEEEIGKQPEKEFRMMIIKMIKNLENRMEKMQESINKDLEELKNKHIETNNTVTEIKNTLKGINSRISEAVE